MHCLETQCLSAFPVIWKRRRGDVVKWSTTLQVYCSCRMPEQPECTMVECSQCKEWFHVDTCVTVPPQALGSGEKWFCDLCSVYVN